MGIDSSIFKWSSSLHANHSMAAIAFCGATFIKRTKFFDTLQSYLATVFSGGSWLLFLNAPALSILLLMPAFDLFAGLFINLLLYLRHQSPFASSLYACGPAMWFGSLTMFVAHAWLPVHEWLLATLGIANIKSVLVEICDIWLIKMLVNINLWPANAWKIAIVHCWRQILACSNVRPLCFLCNIIWNFELNLIRAT